ncbi:MAG: 4-hydroxy-tetrahydrodipicolinate reductase [Clostridiales bacterium]|nr:4-hydroxy-tetrahydrodipicolinate reductase [Clostridiales bacterium]
MLKIIISGCNGKMGQVVESICSADSQVQVVAGFDVNQTPRSYPVYVSPANFTGEADVIIDFSSPRALDGLLAFAVERGVPAVLATTGYSQEQLAQIEKAAKTVPIFRSANMSLGINVVLDLVKRASAILGDAYDIEIVERHHNRKVDAPSGTALMLADAAQEGLDYEADYTYGRHDRRQARPKNEIGISSVRGGTIVGVHEVIFAGRDEVIEIRHEAQSREIFASGAVKAAKFLVTVPQPGLYDMQALVAAQHEEGGSL